MSKHEKSHQNSHLRWNRNTSLKPFPCRFPLCHKSFTAKSSLRHHLIHCHSSLLSDAEEDSDGRTTTSSSLQLQLSDQAPLDENDDHSSSTSSLSSSCCLVEEFTEQFILNGGVFHFLSNFQTVKASGAGPSDFIFSPRGEEDEARLLDEELADFVSLPWH